MKYLILILFIIFGLQNDTIRIDTARINTEQKIMKKDLNIINSDLDSIIAILKDTINNKKR